ncbi:MAG: secretin N-terminal domain-containing protein [Pseudomonadales bacterium]|nr:secretin N-terminal domain-containing protein [Pseudomonadales bacterium]
MNTKLNRQWGRQLLLLGFLALLSACQSQQPDLFQETMDAMLTSADADQLAAGNTAADSSQKNKETTTTNAAVDDSHRTVARFDVLADQVPVRPFLMGLVQGTDYNMIVHPSIQGELSLELKQVSLDEVLAIVRDMLNLHMETNGTLIRVIPNQLETRIFTLDYVNLQRKGVSDMQVSTGSIKDAGNGGGSGSGSNGSQNSANNGGGSINSAEVVGSRVTTENEAEFWLNLQAAVTSIIGQGEGRRVIVMEQSGVIVVSALRSELANVDRFLKLSENAMHRQVILEAKILEVVLNEQFQSGIDWTELGEVDGGSVDFELNGAALQSPDGAGGVFSVGMAFTDFGGIMQLLEAQGRVRVLSSPRIATVNNQKAVIKVGTDEFFVTNVTSTTTTGTSTTTTPSVTLTPFFSGIALDVTPQISKDGTVILHIHPTVSEVNDQSKLVTIGNDTVTLPLALSTIRESDSIVRAKNNQVIVIGGLMKSENRDSKSGVPWVQRIPGIGNGFTQRRFQSLQSELVILVRPVVSDQQTQQEELWRSLDRISRLES